MSVYDGAGQRVGRVLGFDPVAGGGAGGAVVALKVKDRLLVLAANRAGLVATHLMPGGSLHFESNDCSGQAYLAPQAPNMTGSQVQVLDQVVWQEANTVELIVFRSQSDGDVQVCFAVPEGDPGFEALLVRGHRLFDLKTFFRPPFSIRATPRD